MCGRQEIAKGVKPSEPSQNIARRNPTLPSERHHAPPVYPGVRRGRWLAFVRHPAAGPSRTQPRGEDAFKKFEVNSTKADVRKHLTEGFAYARMNGITPPWSK